jgi:hypothetical protein
VQGPDAGLALVGAERRATIWLAIYAIGLIALVLIVIGDLASALFLIVVTEVIFLTLRPQPKFDVSTYRPSVSARWQPALTTLRWAVILDNAWVIGASAVGLTIATLIVLVIIIVAGWHHAFGVANLMVLVLFGAWVTTRPLWIAPLRKALKVGATKQLGPYMATLYVGTDGVDIDLRPPTIGAARRNYRFSVGFAELDEVRMMDGLTAQGYLASMDQYDPSFSMRMEWELLRFLTDQKYRPSLVTFAGIGPQLLLRSSSLFYMIGNADQFGPPAVAAWQAWRAAHDLPPTQTAQEPSAGTATGVQSPGVVGPPQADPGQLSADGRWRWDGTRWVLAQTQLTSHRRSRSWGWVLAGCSTVVVLAAVGGGYGIYTFIQGVKNGSNTCLPSDFPRYPGARYAEFTFELNGAYPGNTCHAVFESNDEVASVTAYYESKLNTGDWQVTPIGSQTDTVTFQPAKSEAPFGTVQVALSNTHTEITIDLFTSTCLPLGFPTYPGAKFGGQNVDVGGGTRGCHILFVSNDSVAAATAFYKRELNTGNWQVTSSAAGQVGFRLKNGKATDAYGTVTISIGDDRTQIKVDAYP